MNKLLEKIDIPEKLIELLNKNPIPKLQEEITDFYFIKSERLREAQEEYRIDEITGKEITGDEKGKWKNQWLVIGSGVADDPLFIDLREEQKGKNRKGFLYILQQMVEASGCRTRLVIL